MLVYPKYAKSLNQIFVFLWINPCYLHPYNESKINQVEGQTDDAKHLIKGLNI